jgi:hypothetical protein
MKGLLALVPLPAIVVAALFFADTLAGGRVLWPPARVTLADAIALRNAGEAAAQLMDGVDPNAPSVLVDASPRRTPQRILPAEAAVLSGDTRLLDLLARHGARFDEPLLVQLYCQADRVGENEVRSWIEARLGRTADCGQ